MIKGASNLCCSSPLRAQKFVRYAHKLRLSNPTPKWCSYSRRDPKAIKYKSPDGGISNSGATH